MLFPYGIQNYKRGDLPDIRLENLFLEQTPATPAKVALLPRPGLAPHQSLGVGPVGAVYQDPGSVGGATLVVSGGILYSGTQALGSVAAAGRVQIDATITTALIATGAGFFSSDGSTVGAVAFPDGAGVSSVVVFGGYVFAARTGTRRIYFTLDPTVWDGLDYLSAEATNGAVVGMVKVGDQLWVFSEQSTEIFVLSGDPERPIQALQGRVFDKGTLARDTIVKMDNSVVWVGHDGLVYRGESAPTRISDHGIEELISTSDAGDLSAWYYPWAGHSFYVLGTTNGTVAYDAATKQWHALGSHGRPRWRAHLGAAIGRDVIAGDDETGQLWRLDGAALMDGDDEIERWFTMLLDERGFVDSLSLDCSTGDAPLNAADGVIEMRSSRDSGRTWAAWRSTTLGAAGKGRHAVRWNRCGIVDEGGMLIHVRMTDPRPARISHARVNDVAAGRSR